MRSDVSRYDDLDGFRTIAAFAIIFCHVYANGDYSGTWTDFLQRPTSWFVPLFFIISGFGMCCGYYNKILERSISVQQFYSRRIIKIVPFFVFLIFLDVVSRLLQHQAVPCWEVLADLTLLFNFLPGDSISVIGVGWALGVIFLFYFLFPYFVYLLSSKPRAFLSFTIFYIIGFGCVLYPPFCGDHFDKTRFIYNVIYFILGGLIYIYREQISCLGKNIKLFLGFLTLFATLSLWLVPTPLVLRQTQLLIIWGLWLVSAVCGNHLFLSNRFTKFISSISLEIYLSHMVIFRIIQKIGLLHLVGDDDIQFMIAFVITTIFTILFSYLSKYMISYLMRVSFLGKLQNFFVF